jgi:hypothetical protein
MTERDPKSRRSSARLRDQIAASFVSCKGQARRDIPRAGLRPGRQGFP